jgi:hypothetical protein
MQPSMLCNWSLVPYRLHYILVIIVQQDTAAGWKPWLCLYQTTAAAATQQLSFLCTPSYDF